MPTHVSPIKVPIQGQDKLSKKLDKLEKRSKRFQQKMNKIGGTLTRSVTLPLAAAGVGSIKLAKESYAAMEKTDDAEQG